MRFLRTAAWMSVLLFLSSGVVPAQDAKEVLTVGDMRHKATQSFDAALKKLDAILRLETDEESQTVQAFSSLAFECQQAWAATMGQIVERLQSEKTDTKSHNQYQSRYDRFMRELLSHGELIAGWRHEVLVERMDLEDDSESFPKKRKKLMEDLKLADEVIREARHLASGDAKIPAETAIKKAEQYQKDLKRKQTLLRNIRGSLEKMRDRSLAKYGADQTLDSAMEKALGVWAETEARHGDIMQRWRDYLQTKWPKLVTDTWEAFCKAQKEYDKIHEPLVKESLFDSFAEFKGKKFSELASGLDDLLRDLQVFHLEQTDRHETLVKIREEWDREQELSKQERAMVLAHARKFGADKWRELVLASARAAGGALGARERRLILARNDPGSDVYKKAEKELELMEKNRHPEQIAAQKAMDDFEKARAEEDRPIQKMMDARKRRRAKLGLSPDFD